jgi:hypothetical protein
MKTANCKLQILGRKIILWTTGIGGALLIFLLISLLLLPYIITLEPVRQKIMAGISQRIDGRVVFQKVDFSFFPRPRIVIQQAQVWVPEKVSVVAEGITIAPQIIPLLQGKVRISLIKAEAPTIILEIPGKSPQTEKSIPLPSAIIQEQLPLLLKLLESEAPQLTMEVENGRLTLRAERQTVFWFQDIQGRVTLPPDQLRIDLTCKSNLWENASIAAKLRSEDLSGNANIQATGLNPQELLNFLAPATAPNLGGSRGSLKMNLEVDRGRIFRGKFQGSSPSLVFQREEKKSSLKGISLSGAFRMEGEKATISLVELNLQSPRARFGGEFHVDLAAPLFRVELTGREMDVSPAREILTDWVGKIEPFQTIFGILREGNVPYVSFKTHGRSPADLGELKNISVQGNLVGGRIFLSESLTGLKDIHFDLRKVQGGILLSRGILEGRNLAAQWEKTIVSQGLLKLGLEGEDAPFHLEALADADLAQFPPFLKKIMRKETFSEEMDRFQELQGRGQGRLTLGETLNSIQPSIEIQEMTLSSRYDRIPYPLQVESVQASYGGGKIAVQNLKGSIGRSSFKEISAQINLGEPPYIAIPSGKSSLAIEEIYAWLTSIERFKVPLQDIKSLNGVMTLSSVNLKGPLLQPEKWDYRIAGEIEKLTMEAPMTPGPLAIPTAKFEINPERILLQDSQVNFLDAALEVSAEGNGWQHGLHGFEGTFRGNLGAKAMEWASPRFQLPADIRIRAPFSISQARLSWDRKKGLSINGNCRWPKGPGASIDFLYTPDELRVNRLLIADDHSRADMGVKFQQRELRLDFKGNLEKITVDRILVKNDFLGESIRGDFHAHVFIDNLLRSTALGKLAGTGLRLALPIKLPLILHSFSLDADQRQIRVQSATLGWEERHVTMEGSMDFLPEAFLLDMNVSIDGLQWEKIEKILKTQGQKTQSAKDGRADRKLEAASSEDAQFPPLRGRIGVKSPFFEYEKYTWRPLDIEITFPPEGVKVAILEANACGISTTGVVKIASGDVALDFHPLAKNQEVSSSAPCLLGKPFAMSGTFRLDGRIKGQGQPQALLQSLKGPWQIEAEDGRLYHGSIVIEILGLVNLAELFAKDKKDLPKGEMSYKTLRAKGHVESGKVFIQELAMNTPEMQLFSQGEIDLVTRHIDLVLAVAPLKTVDWIVRNIPILGYVLGETLVSIPVKVQGDLYDPAIIPLDPSEIGLGFLGIMKRTLNLPFKLIKPVFKAPEKTKQKPSPNP